MTLKPLQNLNWYKQKLSQHYFNSIYIYINLTITETYTEFDSLYKRRLAINTQDNYTYTFFATVAYDALWTFALALNRTNEMVGGLIREEILNMTQCRGTDEETGVKWEVVSLENFTYSNQLMGCIIRWNLERTDFVGVSVSHQHY